MNEQIDKIIYDALEEDIPTIDITSDYLLSHQEGEAIIIAGESGVISGVSVMKRIFQILDDEVYIKIINHDGSYVEQGDIIAIISGNVCSILKANTLVSNIISRMSAIATKTKTYVEQVEDTFTKIMSTRNTTPNLRILEHLAVTHGGGINFQQNLSDQVVITLSHIKLYGHISKAFEEICKHIDHDTKVAIEVDTFEQFLESIQTECDIIFLRNMTDDLIEKCNAHNSRKILGVFESDSTRIKKLSKTGIDVICVDELTHSNKIFKIQINLSK